MARPLQRTSPSGFKVARAGGLERRDPRSCPSAHPRCRPRHPGGVEMGEESSPGTPVWSHDGGVCTGESYKQVVKLTFFRGASLKDPKKLFNSSLEGNSAACDRPPRRGEDQRSCLQAAHPRRGGGQLRSARSTGSQEEVSPALACPPTPLEAKKKRKAAQYWLLATAALPLVVRTWFARLRDNGKGVRVPAAAPKLFRFKNEPVNLKRYRLWFFLATF